MVATAERLASQEQHRQDTFWEIELQEFKDLPETLKDQKNEVEWMFKPEKGGWQMDHIWAKSLPSYAKFFGKQNQPVSRLLSKGVEKNSPHRAILYMRFVSTKPDFVPRMRQLVGEDVIDLISLSEILRGYRTKKNRAGKRNIIELEDKPVGMHFSHTKEGAIRSINARHITGDTVLLYTEDVTIIPRGYFLGDNRPQNPLKGLTLDEAKNVIFVRITLANVIKVLRSDEEFAKQDRLKLEKAFNI